MDGIQGFLAMGGYGAFVWSAFALTAVVMVWLLVSTLRRLRERERMLASLQTARPRRRAPEPARGEGAP